MTDRSPKVADQAPVGPRDVGDEPHGTGPDEHEAQAGVGHDDHGAEPLGPVDVYAWGALAGGIALGLAVALCVALAVA